MDVIKKYFKVKAMKPNDDTLTIEHFISTESMDRSKDVVLADGMVMDGWPVVLCEHGYGQTGYEPIAKCLDLKVSINDDGKKGILARTQYYDGSKLVPPDNTGRRLYEKAKGDFMPYFSIRFRSIESEPIAAGGYLYKRWKLIEYSQVGVPDNVEAMVAKNFTEEEIEKDGQELLTLQVKTDQTEIEKLIKLVNELEIKMNTVVDSINLINMSNTELKNNLSIESKNIIDIVSKNVQDAVACVVSTGVKPNPQTSIESDSIDDMNAFKDMISKTYLDQIKKSISNLKKEIVS